MELFCLSVEDNPDVRDVAVSMLEQLGYETQAAPDAAAALQVLEQGSFDQLLAGQDHAEVTPLDDGAWLITLSGEVRPNASSK